MQRNNKATINNTSLKTLCVAFFLILFSVNVWSIDECESKQPADKIPCLILLQTSVYCNTVAVDFFNESVFLSSQTMWTYSDFICAANFTYTQLGTYNFNYSIGDYGALTVEEGFKMINLLYFALIVVIALLIYALYLQSNELSAISGMMLLIFGVWFVKNGFSIYQNMLTDTFGVVMIAVGGWLLIMSTLSMIEGD
jgi:hypothetical protein